MPDQPVLGNEDQGEDLTGLSNEDLDAREEEILARGDEVSSGELTDEDLNELDSLADQRDAVRAERTRRQEDHNQRTERATSALARLRGEVEETDDETEEVVDEAETEEEDAEERVPVLASGNKRSRRGPGGLNVLRPGTAQPKAKNTPRQAFMVATGSMGLGMEESSPFDSPLDVAKALTQKRNSWTRIPAGVHDDRIRIATGTKTFGDERRLGADIQQNFALLNEARADQLSRDAGALVASGPFCTPLTPLYDFWRVAVPQDPVERSLPVVSADRGGLRFIGAICDFTEAFGGITTLTPLLNLDPNDPDFKACARVTCPTVQEKVVSSVSTCVEFGNLQYRTFPELTENFLRDLAVAFSITKETLYLDAIHAAAVATTLATMTYGASRSLLFAWTMGAVAFRKRHSMPRDATLQMWAPDWAFEMIRTDMAMDFSDGTENINVPDAMINDALTSRNLDVTWFADRPTAATTQKFDGVQAAGALNCWPNTVGAYMTAPGTFVRLDGGTLDIGLVRDSTLNSTNDLQIFMEEWLGIAQVGCEVELITVTTEASGAAPAGVTPWACP